MTTTAVGLQRKTTKIIQMKIMHDNGVVEEGWRSKLTKPNRAQNYNRKKYRHAPAKETQFEPKNRRFIEKTSSSIEEPQVTFIFLYCIGHIISLTFHRLS